MTAPDPRKRILRIAEDLLVLASAGLLAAWAFSGRSAAWNVALAAAMALMVAIFVRRLAGWIRAKREPTDEP